jgi:hypothetical protein
METKTIHAFIELEYMGEECENKRGKVQKVTI